MNLSDMLRRDHKWHLKAAGIYHCHICGIICIDLRHGHSCLPSRPDLVAEDDCYPVEGVLLDDRALREEKE